MALPGPKRGRPEIEIDGDLVQKLASFGANLKEIATMLKCSEDTLQRRFQDRLQSGWEVMKVSVKRAQYQLAVEKKNPTMLIWLGKNYLGQSDTAGNRQPSGVDHLESLFKALMEGPVKRGDTAPQTEDESKQSDPGGDDDDDGKGGGNSE